MMAMDSDPKSDVQFKMDHLSHHKERPMVEAKLNAKAVDMVRQHPWYIDNVKLHSLFRFANQKTPI